MPPVDVAEVLARLPHFRMVGRDVVERIARGCRIVDYRRAEPIVRAGEPARAFFVVLSGSVRAYRLTADGGRHVVHHFQEGQSFAEAALLSFGTYPVSFEALQTPTRIVEVGGQNFLDVLRSDPRHVESIVASLCTRLLKLVERVDELSVASAASRLAGYLLRLPARGSAARLQVGLPMSKKDLAAHLSITPETLSRILRRWKDRGLVETSGRTLLIKESGILEAIADDSTPHED